MHEKPRYECGECSKIFRSEKAVNQHLRSFHLPNQCRFCKKLFKNANTRRSHVLNCKRRTNCAVQTRRENKEEDDVTLAEASTSLEDSNGKKKDESVDEATQNSRKEFEDTSPDSNVARYSKKCTLCNKVYHSRSGLHKHMKTHKLVDMNNSVNDLIVVDDE